MPPLISHIHKAIFFHTPKCAGNTINQLLSENIGFDADIDPSIFKALLPCGYYRRLVINTLRRNGFSAAWRTAMDNLRYLNFPTFTPPDPRSRHRVISSLTGERTGVYQLLEKSLPGSCMDDYFKFSFVRNPYERMVSAYAFYHSILTSCGKSLVDFERFVYAISERDFMACGSKLTTDEASAIEWHVMPMNNHLSDQSGTLKLDFVGKVETLERDWLFVAKQLGLAETSIKKLNTSKHKPYRHYYGGKLQQTVFDYYEADFEAFDYSGELE